MQDLIDPFDLLISKLKCPECDGLNISLKGIASIARRSDGQSHINSGILTCASCSQNYPVIDKIPRLLRKNQLNADELRFLEINSKISLHEPEYQYEINISEEERFAEIEKLVRQKLKYSEKTTQTIKNRIESDICYRTYQASEKYKYVQAIHQYIYGERVSSICDVGGGQGGTLTCFADHFLPQLSVLVDIDIEWARVAMLRDGRTMVIRADASNLPFKNDAFDLMLSAAALEHIADWKGMLSELLRVGERVFLTYNPNGAFFYDYGHVDAPFVTYMPKSIGKYVAWFFHTIRRTGRDLSSLENELSKTFYVPRRTVEEYLRAHSIKVVNIFPAFIEATVLKPGIHHARIKLLLAKFPWIRKKFTSLVTFLGIEPAVYLYIKKQ